MSQDQFEFIVDPAEPVIDVRRVVNAPRALVWDCYTKLEHLRRWKTPKGCEMVDAEIDMRKGTVWRVRYRRPDGAEFGFHGEIRDAVAPERFTRTFVMDGSPDEAIETVVLSDASAGKTLISTKTVYATMAVRDRMVQFGGEMGAKGGFEALDAVLESLTSS
ncbi:MAG TPA: SRPBCC domain-containing protein [Polyangiaceae bacterium]|jgi:uncharacterized protein YndB with AHSA1/START domain|nr:SRPBCC domain-containing protein [Polyangiaceae bacterium]